MRYSLTDGWVKNNTWVKNIFKEQFSEDISRLILERLTFPSIHGPHIDYTKERPLDIICEIIKTTDRTDLRSRLKLCTAMILSNHIDKKSQQSTSVLSSIFEIIRICKIETARHLVHKWLTNNKNLLNSKIQLDKDLFLTALFCFATIQYSNSKELTSYWLELWHSEDSFIWPIAFFGLSIQNFEDGCKEISLLISRSTGKGFDKAQPILVGLWHTAETKEKFTSFVKSNLEDSPIGGMIVNIIYPKLTEHDRKKFLSSLA